MVQTEKVDETNPKKRAKTTATATTATATATTETEEKKQIQNIYEKLLIIQEKIKVKKGNTNEFANFKYRNINDILVELKPLLKETKTVLKFNNGHIEACPEDISREKYMLTLQFINIEMLTDRIEEDGEIYIDRSKRKMDLSQICLAAKTFLKKTLLEDLLLINEDDDPDSHDNTQGNQQNKQGNPQNTQGNPQGNGNKSKNIKKEPLKLDKDVQKLYKTIVHWIVMKLSNKDIEEAKKILETATAFKMKGGKEVKGVSNIDDLTDARLKYLYENFAEKHKELFNEMSKKYDEKLKKEESKKNITKTS